MNIRNYFFAAALLGITALSSCKKDDDAPSGGSGNLQAGKGTITFSTSSSFGGSSSFSGTNPLFSFATNTSGSVYDQVTIQTIEYAGTAAKTAQLVILYKKGLNTGGALNANFSNSNSDTIYPVLVISNSANTKEAYASESGAFNISKFSATEIEGTFSGKFVNEEEGTSINVTNGTFAGKF